MGCEWTVEVAPSETVQQRKAWRSSRWGSHPHFYGGSNLFSRHYEGLGSPSHGGKSISSAYSIPFVKRPPSRLTWTCFACAPGQTLEMWALDLRTAAELEPEHLSTYCLTFEEDTAMYVRLSEGKVELGAEREAERFREKALEPFAEVRISSV